MFDKNIKNKQKIILAAIFIFVFAAGFGFTKTNKVYAGSCNYYKEVTGEGSGIDLTAEVTDKAECNQFCAKDFEGNCPNGMHCTCPSGYTCSNCRYFDSSKKASEDLAATADKSGGNDPAPTSSDVCSWLNWFSSTFFNCLLLKVLTFIGYLVSAAATLFEWIIDADNLKSVLNNNIIYTIWGTVRDVLNIAFILVLLFSAFCTVFQVEKFNYKQILRTLIIMALLVNFSFPISRVIIDFSNVIMFSFLKSMGGADSFARIADTGGLAKIINPGTIPDVSYLIAAIVFTFILAVTFIVIAVLMVIRTVALAILIIFSPVAFVGSIVPFLSSKASAWWDSLFKYSFFGPIMVFMMYIAVEMMSVIATKAPSFDTIAKAQTSGSGMAELVASYAFFSIPIVILWIGIGTAQTMSIAGASAVVGRGQKFITWGLGRASGYDYLSKYFGGMLKKRETQRGARIQRSADRTLGGWDEITGRGLGAVSGGRLGRERRRRAEEERNSRVREYMKNIDNITDGDELANIYQTARNQDEREAILRRASSVGELGAVLNRNGQTNDRTGLAAFMQNQFGNNERSARLTSTLSGLEASKHNVQFSGAAAYNAAANRYEFNPAAPAVQNAQFGAAGGEHAQNVARNLRPGFIITTDANGAMNFNNDFENFLQNLGNDFDNPATGLSTHQIDQIPNTVIRQIGAALAQGAAPTGRTADLINALHTAGRI